MRHVQFTLDDHDHDKLERCAKKKRQSKADLLRSLIDRKFAALFPEETDAREPAR